MALLLHRRNTGWPGWIALAALVTALVAALVLGCAAAHAQSAAEIGQIKLARGAVTVQRGAQAIAATVGLRLLAQDAVQTGADAVVGITMRDNSLLSLGPNSVLRLEQFEFDETSHLGRFDSSLQRGTLAMSSGRLAKQSPLAVKLRTPTAVLGVRGTEFLVAVEP